MGSHGQNTYSHSFWGSLVGPILREKFDRKKTRRAIAAALRRTGGPMQLVLECSRGAAGYKYNAHAAVTQCHR